MDKSQIAQLALELLLSSNIPNDTTAELITSYNAIYDALVIKLK